LNNPNKLLDGVVEVEFDLVGRGPNGLVSSELELSDKVLVRVLGHATAFIRIKEDVVNIQRGSNKRGLVSFSSGDRAGITSSPSRAGEGATKRGDGPEALINRAEIKVDLDLVVLKSNQRERKSGVGAEPELEGNVKSGLRKSVTGSAHLTGGRRVARAINIGERRIRDERKLTGVSNHLEVPTLLLGRHRELIPDVHPVTVLAIDALTSDLNLNLSYKLLSGEV
jgi:hypothetical protein